MSGPTDRFNPLQAQHSSVNGAHHEGAAAPAGRRLAGALERRRSHTPVARESETKLRPLPSVLTPLVSEVRWLVWRWETNEKGRLTKVPYQAVTPDTKASSTNPRTWAEYETAKRLIAEGKADGIGFALHGSTFAAFDVDDCRDPVTGAIAPW